MLHSQGDWDVLSPSEFFSVSVKEIKLIQYILFRKSIFVHYLFM